MMEQFIIACMPRLIAHFYRQVFVCPQAAEYPFASVDPTQGLHIQDVVRLETCSAGEGCFHLHIVSTYDIGDQEFS